MSVLWQGTHWSSWCSRGTSCSWSPGENSLYLSKSATTGIEGMPNEGHVKEKSKIFYLVFPFSSLHLFCVSLSLQFYTLPTEREFYLNLNEFKAKKLILAFSLNDVISGGVGKLPLGRGLWTKFSFVWVFRRLDFLLAFVVIWHIRNIMKWSMIWPMEMFYPDTPSFCDHIWSHVKLFSDL